MGMNRLCWLCVVGLVMVEIVFSVNGKTDLGVVGGKNANPAPLGAGGRPNAKQVPFGAVGGKNANPAPLGPGGQQNANPVPFGAVGGKNASPAPPAPPAPPSAGRGGGGGALGGGNGGGIPGIGAGNGWGGVFGGVPFAGIIGGAGGGIYRPSVVCSDPGPCYKKRLTCPSSCFKASGKWGPKGGGGGGGGGCTMDCKHKCRAYC